MYNANEKNMIDINKKTDQNLVCVDNLKVTWKTTDVNLYKINDYIVKLTIHISVECPCWFKEEVPRIYKLNIVINTAYIAPYSTHKKKLR